MKLSPAWDLQSALWRHLTGNSALTEILGGAKLFDDVPQDENFPFVTLGEIRSNDWSTQTSRGHEHFLTLHAWSRASGRAEVQAILQALDEALAGLALPLRDHRLITFSLVFWDARRELDGRTYHGLARFRAVTEVKPSSPQNLEISNDSPEGKRPLVEVG